MKIKIVIVVILGASLWCSIATNKRYNNISKKLDMIVENSEKGKIDSLQLEIMDIGARLDSCIISNESLEYYIKNTK